MRHHSRQHKISSLLAIGLLLLNIVQQTATSPYFQHTTSLKLEEQCKDIASTSNCHCSMIGFEISCPGSVIDPKIDIRILPNDSVEMRCHRLDPSEYTILPNMNIGNITIVKMRQCPLQAMTPIQKILQVLGITGVTQLFFEIGAQGGYLTKHHFKGLQDLGRLRLNLNGVSVLPDDVFSDLKNLTWLELRVNHVQLSSDIFASLENLNFLELGHNNLHDLPAGIFRNQKNLKQLNLWSNNLTNLTKGTFEGVSSITELDLSGNNIVTLRPDVFSLLKNLRKINLNANYFESLPVGLFAENRNISLLRLNNNRVPLKHLPAGLLSNLPHLSEVQLRCNLETVPEDLFANSKAVTNITISGNNLTELPRMLFADQRNMLDLDLSKNQLVTLPNDILQNAYNLKVLRLSYNQLENVTSEIFESLENLEMLFIDNNKLVTIHRMAFKNTNRLTYIDMENNQINLRELDMEYGDGDQFELNSPFHHLNELQTLNLRNNEIQTIFRDWRLTKLKLTFLDLSYNNITWISEDDLSFLSRHIFVNLTHNFIRTINFRNIEYTDIKENQKIQVAFDDSSVNCDCELLHFVLFLQGKVGSNIKDSLKISVGTLQCSGPQLPKSLENRLITSLSPMELVCPLDYESSTKKLCPVGCTCWVRSFDYVVIVNCSNAEFTEIPNLPKLSPVQNGTELHVENNNITQLPLATDKEGYECVIELHAANNSLNEISDENLPKRLKYLDVSHNKLQSLSNSTLSALYKTIGTNSLGLNYNPWLCDCESQYLLQFIQTNFKLISDLNEMQCADGNVFQKLSPANICPVSQGLVISVALLIAVFGLCVGTLAALYYKHQQAVKVWLYAHNMCLWFVNEEELDRDKKYDAFISYSHVDEDFITDFLVPELENGPTPFKLCLHVRDWVVGESIQHQIFQSVEDSRRTIVVLSRDFIESNWARMEFSAAHAAALQEGRARIITILYGDIGNTDNLDPELKSYLETHTYLKWDDPLFWNKLRYAMPHTSNHLSGLVKNALKSSTDDKLELIKPLPVTPPLTTPPAEQASKNPLMAHLNGQAPICNGNGNISQPYYLNGKLPNGHNGHINGAFIINTNAKQSDV